MQVVGLHKHKVTRHTLAAVQGPSCREPDVAAAAVQRLIASGAEMYCRAQAVLGKGARSLVHICLERRLSGQT
jgi:hypothetical protein